MKTWPPIWRRLRCSARWAGRGVLRSERADEETKATGQPLFGGQSRAACPGRSRRADPPSRATPPPAPGRRGSRRDRAAYRRRALWRRLVGASRLFQATSVRISEASPRSISPLAPPVRSGLRCAFEVAPEPLGAAALATRQGKGAGSQSRKLRAMFSASSPRMRTCARIACAAASPARFWMACAIVSCSASAVWVRPGRKVMKRR